MTCCDFLFFLRSNIQSKVQLPNNGWVIGVKANYPGNTSSDSTGLAYVTYFIDRIYLSDWVWTCMLSHRLQDSNWSRCKSGQKQPGLLLRKSRRGRKRLTSVMVETGWKDLQVHWLKKEYDEGREQRSVWFFLLLRVEYRLTSKLFPLEAESF